MYAWRACRGVDSLPVRIPPISLCELRVEIDEMACEEQVVARLYGHGVAHEGCGVDGEGTSHAAGYAGFYMSAWDLGPGGGRLVEGEKRNAEGVVGA